MNWPESTAPVVVALSPAVNMSPSPIPEIANLSCPPFSPPENGDKPASDIFLGAKGIAAARQATSTMISMVNETAAPCSLRDRDSPSIALVSRRLQYWPSNHHKPANVNSPAIRKILLSSAMQHTKNTNAPLRMELVFSNPGTFENTARYQPTD